MSCKCLAPLLLHPSRSEGMGVFIRVPESRGLLEITFIFSYSAISRKDLPSMYLSAKA